MKGLKMFLSILSVVVLSGCGSAYTRHATLKDEMFGVEDRANGVVVVWVVHDDVGAYCFNDPVEAKKAHDLFYAYDGRVQITYNSGNLFDGCPSSTATMTVYLATKIEKFHAVEQ